MQFNDVVQLCNSMVKALEERESVQNQLHNITSYADELNDDIQDLHDALSSAENFDDAESVYYDALEYLPDDYQNAIESDVSWHYIFFVNYFYLSSRISLYFHFNYPLYEAPRTKLFLCEKYFRLPFPSHTLFNFVSSINFDSLLIKWIKKIKPNSIVLCLSLTI